ncbi:E3 ubiquitin ligase PARAQUAT TOLERANCE 3 [Linum perenne]
MTVKVVSYRFESSNEYSEIPISGGGEYISGMELKMAILRSKYKAKKGVDPRKNPDGLCFGTDLDFLITNAQTNDEYNEDALIPTGTCLLIRPVLGDRRRRWIDTSSISLVGEEKESSSEPKESNVTANPDCKRIEEDFHDFGENPLQESEKKKKKNMELSREEEELRIMELVNTPALTPLPSGQSQTYHHTRKRCRVGRYTWRRNDSSSSVSISPYTWRRNDSSSSVSISTTTTGEEKRQRRTTSVAPPPTAAVA